MNQTQSRKKEVVAQFHADDWARLAKDTGMKYIVLASKYHDGFCLWVSEIIDYNVMEVAPDNKSTVIR